MIAFGRLSGIAEAGEPGRCKTSTQTQTAAPTRVQTQQDAKKHSLLQHLAWSLLFGSSRSTLGRSSAIPNNLFPHMTPLRPPASPHYGRHWIVSTSISCLQDLLLSAQAFRRCQSRTFRRTPPRLTNPLSLTPLTHHTDILLFNSKHRPLRDLLASACHLRKRPLTLPV